MDKRLSAALFCFGGGGSDILVIGSYLPITGAFERGHPILV